MEATFTPLLTTQTPVFIAQQTQPVEAPVHLIDFRALSTVSVLVSGLRLQIDSALSPAGLEHVILSGSATLGAFNFLMQTAFAIPFASINITPYTFLVPIGPMLFVTQRVQMTTQILGVTVSNLTMVDDVNFQHPFPTLPLGPFGLPLLPTYTTQSQSFRFGDILSLRGTLPGGAALAFTTGINADPLQSLQTKRRSFPGRAHDSKLLTFIREIIALQNLRIGPVTIGTTLSFDPVPQTPSRTLTTTVNALWDLEGVGKLTVALRSPPGGVAPLQLSSISLSMISLPLTLVASFSSTFTLTSWVLSTAIVLQNNPISSLTLQLMGAPGSGMQSFNGSFLITHPAGFTLTIGFTSQSNQPLIAHAMLSAQLSSAMRLSIQTSLQPLTPSMSRTTVAVRYIF